MAKLTYDSWGGEFGVDSRTNWGAWLGYLGVPESNWKAAEDAPDFHKYKMTEEGFIMDHRIPGQNVHLHFYASLDGTWTKCPYPQPTATLWKEGEHNTDSGKPGEWRNSWLMKPVRFQTEIINFAGKGNTVRMVREIQDGGTCINFQVEVITPNSKEVVAGPFSTRFKRISDEMPGEPPAEGQAGSFPTPQDRYLPTDRSIVAAASFRLNRLIGVLLAFGGVVGFAKKGSVPSLIGGVGCGASLWAAGGTERAMKMPKRAILFGTLVSALLSAGMIPRALKTKKVMPAGMVALLGLMSFLHNAMTLKKLKALS